MREGVVRHELETTGETMIHLHLQRLVVSTGVVAKVVAHYRATVAADEWPTSCRIEEVRVDEAVEERPALILRHRRRKTRSRSRSGHNSRTRTEGHLVDVI